MQTENYNQSILMRSGNTFSKRNYLTILFDEERKFNFASQVAIQDYLLNL